MRSAALLQTNPGSMLSSQTSLPEASPASVKIAAFNVSHTQPYVRNKPDSAELGQCAAGPAPWLPSRSPTSWDASTGPSCSAPAPSGNGRSELRKERWLSNGAKRYPPHHRSRLTNTEFGKGNDDVMASGRRTDDQNTSEPVHGL